MKDTPKIGISACLLGHYVRWDGGHKMDRVLIDTMGRHIDFVPVCPETECGLGVPRETLHLEGDPENPSLTTTQTGIDHTARMSQWAKKRLTELEKNKLCGFIFKSDSPSCGLNRVPVYNKRGDRVAEGTGLFAMAFTCRFPSVPAEDADRLHDPKTRKRFIESVFRFFPGIG